MKKIVAALLGAFFLFPFFLFASENTDAVFSQEATRPAHETNPDESDHGLTPFGVRFLKGGQTPALLEKAFLSRDLHARFLWLGDAKTIGGMYNLAKQTSNPEEAGKREALIGHFSYWQKRNPGDVARTLDATIEEYFGKALTIDQAFEETKGWYSGIPAPTEDDRVRDAIRCAGFGGAAAAIALAALVVAFSFAWKRRNRIASFFARLALADRFSSLPVWRKYHVALSVVAFAMLAVAAADVNAPYGFYVFLRIVSCSSFLGFLACGLPFLLKFLSLLAAILYNPIAMVRFNDSDPWIVFNCLSLALLLACWIAQFASSGRAGCPIQRK